MTLSLRERQVRAVYLSKSMSKHGVPVGATQTEQNISLTSCWKRGSVSKKRRKSFVNNMRSTLTALSSLSLERNHPVLITRIVIKNIRLTIVV